MAPRGKSAAILGFLMTAAAAAAAVPPTVVNYQGVLRSAANAPLTGTYDMEFRFWSAAAGGNEILIDRHTAALGSAVTVSGGLFAVHLGEGSISDGSGPGTYTDLAAVFRDHGAVWLAVRVGAEDLSPRTQLVSAAYALNASHLGGKAPGEFLDTSATGQTKSGPLTVFSPAAGSNGLTASGAGSGGVFFDADNSGFAYLGYGNQGAYASGTSMGGEFHDTDSTGYAYLGWEDKGVFGSGSTYGGHFEQYATGAQAWLGFGNVGAYAKGPNGGGLFEDADDTGYARCGYGDTGVYGQGSVAGGEFHDASGTGSAYLGQPAQGVKGTGTGAGGYFTDSDGSGYAYVGYGDVGVHGQGNVAGGYFRDSSIVEGGEAYVGYGSRGIWARGSFAGGTFSHPDGVTFWADVSTPTKKITGTGSVSFVQNHPRDPSRVIVYTAPEGNEVATYTRGSARLDGGVARIALDETFGMVTNPDVGLTAHLTPRGEEASLYVVSLTTREIVVRSGSGSPDAAFDYLVYGLRLGFEQEAVIQAKEREAPLPDPAAFEAKLQGAPEARERTPLARFARMQGAAPGTLDLTAARSLEAEVRNSGAQELGRMGREPEQAAGVEQTPAPANATTRREAPAALDPLAGLPRFPLAEPVEAGDVLALDPQHPGRLRRTASAADPNVVGLAAGPSESVGGAEIAPVVGTGFAEVRVDAGYGEILPGDLLTSSPTPGHAMRAHAPGTGTVLGKAVEGLGSGTGTIRILVMPR